MQKSNLDIIIPCYNPPNGWAEGIVSNYNFICKATNGYPNLILVNDGSSKNFDPDDLSLLRESIDNFKLVNLEQNQGKGAALRSGVKASISDKIIFTDIDFPYESTSFFKVLDSLNQGYNVVLGVRESDYYKKVPLFRKVLSKSFRFAMKTFLRLKSDDTQCGLKAFDTVGKKYFLQTTTKRFLFDLEFVLYCSQAKEIKLNTVNVRLNPGVVFSKMPMKILLREGMNFIKILFLASKK
jgi:glycosyltransferase involved in cell wall biosynthesis